MSNSARITQQLTPLTTPTMTHHTSISRMHVALDFIGRNSEYRVTLRRRNASPLI